MKKRLALKPNNCCVQDFDEATLKSNGNFNNYLHKQTPCWIINPDFVRIDY